MQYRSFSCFIDHLINWSSYAAKLNRWKHLPCFCVTRSVHDVINRECNTRSWQRNFVVLGNYCGVQTNPTFRPIMNILTIPVRLTEYVVQKEMFLWASYILKNIHREISKIYCNLLRSSDMKILWIFRIIIDSTFRSVQHYSRKEWSNRNLEFYSVIFIIIFISYEIIY